MISTRIEVRNDNDDDNDLCLFKPESNVTAEPAPIP